MGKTIKKGSLTVEASLVLPVFLFAALTILYINKILLLEEKVQWALVRTGREASVEYAVSGGELAVNTLYLNTKMQVYLAGSGVQVSMLRSRFDETTGEMNLVADYRIKLPFALISEKTLVFSEQLQTRAFIGVETRQKGEDREKDVLVYVTDTGRVYHRQLSCTYLKPSISQVKYKDLEYLRSENGEKYYACEGCCCSENFGENQDVYICNYGNRYHSRRNCKKIERNIREIMLSQVGTRQPCSKCGKE